MKDDYRLTGDLFLTQTLMTVCNTDVSIPGRIIFTTEKNEHVQLTYNATDWKVTKEKMQLAEPHEQALKANWDNKTIWRILLTNVSHKKEGSSVYGISN